MTIAYELPSLVIQPAEPEEMPAPVLCTAEIAECSCPDFCERDHDND